MALDVKSDRLPPVRPSTPSTRLLRILRRIGTALAWFVLALLIFWATAAIYIDFRIASLRVPLTLIYILVIAILIKFKGSRWAAILCLASFFCVLLWWLTLKPSNSGAWQPDADRTAWTEMDGDRITIHNLRNCDYRTETEYSNCWSDRTVYLSQLRGRRLLPDELGPELCKPPNYQLSIWRQHAYRILD